MKILAIAAGHWEGVVRGIPTNLHSPRVSEWDLNKPVVDAVEEILNRYEGVQVLRVEDTTGAKMVGLSDRCKAANAANADYFLEVHHNGGLNGGSGGGATAYCIQEGGQAEILRDKLYDAIIQAYPELRGNRANPKTTANFAVLRLTKMPAVLLELGFMDSTTDVPLLLSSDHTSKCAAAIASTFVELWGLTLKAEYQEKEKPGMNEEKVKEIAKEAAEEAAQEVVDDLMDGTGSGDAHGKYSTAAIQWAKENGLIKGLGNGDYAWAKPVTREELVTILYRYHNNV